MNRLAPFALLLSVAVPAAAAAADPPDRLVLPLSDPARPARLEVGVMMGSVTVVPGKTGEVVVHVTWSEAGAGLPPDHPGAGHPRFPVPPPPPPPLGEDPVDREEREERRAGMKKLTSGSGGLEAEEHDNVVEIGSASVMRPADLRIEVPPASSVEASTMAGGEISVTGLSGELVLHNTNGNIRVVDVTGPVNASTVNGNVDVRFGARLANAAMAFSTLNGDVEVTLPADASVNVLLRSDNGDVYSDFDVVLDRQPAKVSEDRDRERYRVSLSRELVGRIGAGGPELFLKTFNGDLLLHRAK
jgi:hypothetical protein